MNDRPMLEVEDLTKRYAGRAAVSGLSFVVGRGEIVGLLGPNGAGKSTTLRILACYLAATSGTVRVAGLDALRQADQVRRRIGYMPEHNPLYPEMRVREYLKFRARIKGLSRVQSRARVDVVIEQFNLGDASRKVIGHLSKGYRQRVGLADALVHEPELIILDEPTIGLDPTQIRTVRQLVKDLAGRHTVLLSTHILPEAEMTCQRVLIMRQGRIVAEGGPDQLQQLMSGGTQIVAEIAAPLPDLQALFHQMSEIESCDFAPAEGPFYRCAITPVGGADLRTLIADLARQQGWPLRELTRSRYSLEDIFMRVTRHEEEEG
jgi:ABC-2 type transport system ATP-binding protein